MTDYVPSGRPATTRATSRCSRCRLRAGRHLRIHSFDQIDHAPVKARTCHHRLLLAGASSRTSTTTSSRSPTASSRSTCRTTCRCRAGSRHGDRAGRRPQQRAVCRQQRRRLGRRHGRDRFAHRGRFCRGGRAATFGLSPIPAGFGAITSKSAAVAYHVDVGSGLLTAYVDGGRPASTPAIARCSRCGAAERHLHVHADRPDRSRAGRQHRGPQGPESVLVITARDFDGDTIAFTNQFTVNVQDDVPA